MVSLRLPACRIGRSVAICGGMSMETHLRYPVEVRPPTEIPLAAPELRYGGPRTEGYSARWAEAIADLGTLFPEAYSSFYRSGVAKK